MISIIIPVKNAAQYLAPCIFSILQQTETNWEAIFVNDHSTDKSCEIIQAIAKRFPKIKILQSKGTGIIPALQTGYQISKGKFITRMDADDIMPLHKLELLKNKIQTLGPGHVVTGKVKYFSAQELGQGYINYQDWLNNLAENNSHYQDLYKECVVPSAGFMIHREDFDKIGAFDSPLYPEDYDLVFRFKKHQLKIVAIPEVIHEWRDHEDRTSRNNTLYSGHYFDLKLHYFLILDYDPKKQLSLIGAGKKGKKLAQKLIDKNVTFQWMTNNPQKIGKEIYGQILQKEAFTITNPKSHQFIISIAAPDEVQKLQLELNNTTHIKSKDYFWFC